MMNKQRRKAIKAIEAELDGIFDKLDEIYSDEDDADQNGRNYLSLYHLECAQGLMRELFEQLEIARE
jgi:hypothetical protein